MLLDNNEIRLISEGWIEHSLTRSNEATFWAWERLDNLVRYEPEEAWKVIEAITRASGNDATLANLAAGPVEDLLAKHGDQFIARIEALARKDGQFRKLLGGVWRNTITEKVWLRIKAVAGPPF